MKSFADVTLDPGIDSVEFLEASDDLVKMFGTYLSIIVALVQV